MSQSTETHQRSIVKAVIYRGPSILIVGAISYLVTGSFTSTSKITVAFAVVETGFYILNERVWNRITWGREMCEEGQVSGPRRESEQAPALRES
jgi:uncharacterized membrane protein